MSRLVKTLALAAALAMPISTFAGTAPKAPTPAPAASPAPQEKHPEIHAAMDKLRAAREILVQKAANDFGGHKKAAVESIDKALEHLNQALNYDK
jgi:hypothetical protein